MVPTDPAQPDQTAGVTGPSPSEPVPAPADAAAPDDSDVHTALPPKVEAWRRRSATGAILTGFALGLQQALETKRDEPSIMMETSGSPPQDLPIEADFEYGRPRQSVVSIRPWLLSDGPEPDAASDSGPTGPAAAPSDEPGAPGSSDQP
jgi:hypothetical protein